MKNKLALTLLLIAAVVSWPLVADPQSCAPAFEWLCLSACDEEMRVCLETRSLIICSIRYDECYEWCGILSGCDE